jgi:hypothetical protein
VLSQASAGPVTLEKPLTASGKVALTRGVTDSTTLFGFYNSADSLRSNESQSDGVPESALGIHIEGPSRDGFRFYPVLRGTGAASRTGRIDDAPYVYPDGKSHDWRLDYDPVGGEGGGTITVTFDGASTAWHLKEPDRGRGTTFDRFGSVTSWIDGNSQDVYWDDVVSTVAQE